MSMPLDPHLRYSEAMLFQSKLQEPLTVNVEQLHGVGHEGDHEFDPSPFVVEAMDDFLIATGLYELFVSEIDEEALRNSHLGSVRGFANVAESRPSWLQTKVRWA
eukprot:1188456-Prorocentrum_minimum.AAC.6